MPLPLVPADERVEDRIAEVGGAVGKVEMPVALDHRSVGKGKRRQGVDIDIDPLPAERHHDAEADVAAQHLLRRDP